MFAEKFRFSPELTGERLALRQVEKKDAPALLGILSDPQVMKYVTQGSLFSFGRSRRVAAELLNDSVRIRCITAFGFRGRTFPSGSCRCKTGGRSKRTP
ncbi:hypothetical protein CM49_02857 [Paenibacillus sp. P1XP2]|nr:hypothetical protein CM49_02857 [Paenibacillus sp. P1XP2]